jgi:predicted membrane protein
MLYMKFTNPFVSFLPQELILLAIFVIYLVFPIQTPSFLSGIIDSPIGMTGIFIITIALFIYSKPILAILYLFVAYELLRRSTVKSILKTSIASGEYKNVENTPTLNDIDLNDRQVGLKSIEHSVDTSLEEDVVNKMAPIGRSEPASYMETGFKPFVETVRGASIA